MFKLYNKSSNTTRIRGMSTDNRPNPYKKLKEKLHDKKRQQFEKKVEEPIFITKQLFRTKGFKYDEDYELYNVDLKTIDGEIFTCESGKENKDILVLIHGFGTTMANYYMIIPSLAKHFHVYTFDLYGMGCSSRVKFDLKTDEEAHNIYLKSIEEWRKALGIKEFYLLGHSLGGYLSTHYLKKYKPNCKGLFLMSPSGFCHIPEDMEMKMQEGRSMIQSKIMKYILKLIEEKHVDLTKLVKLLGIKKLATKYFLRYAKKQSEYERELLVQYPATILALKPSGHKVLGHFLRYGRYSKTPFENFLPELASKYNIALLYGEVDWMDVELAKKTVHKIRNENPNTKLNKLVTIKGAGHNMMFDEPDVFVKMILKFYKKFNTDNNDFFTEFPTYDFFRNISEISYYSNYEKVDIKNAPDNLGLNKMLQKKQKASPDKKKTKFGTRLMTWFGIDKHNQGDNDSQEFDKNDLNEFDNTMLAKISQYHNSEQDSIFGMDPMVVFDEMNSNSEQSSIDIDQNLEFNPNSLWLTEKKLRKCKSMDDILINTKLLEIKNLEQQIVKKANSSKKVNYDHICPKKQEFLKETFESYRKELEKEKWIKEEIKEFKIIDNNNLLNCNNIIDNDSLSDVDKKSSKSAEISVKIIDRKKSGSIKEKIGNTRNILSKIFTREKTTTPSTSFWSKFSRKDS